MHPAIDTLFKALPDVLLQYPGATLRIAFLRAELHPALRPLTHHFLVCEQAYRPLYNDLHDAGFTVAAEDTTGSFDLVLYLATRQHEENLAALSRAVSLLAPGGMVLAAQHNDFGARRLETALKDLTGNLASLSKNHARAFWAMKTEGLNHSLHAEWQTLADPAEMPEYGFYTTPGLFSWKEVDTGSRILAHWLPADLQGQGADLGAGWGYLTHQILSRHNNVTHMTLLEADKKALNMAQMNLTPDAKTTTLDYVWHDIHEGLPCQELDFVVTNPPQHNLHAEDKHLTEAFFTVAAHSLKKGGKMYAVLNRHLPVEEMIKAQFQTINTLAVEQGFKVIEAVR